MLCVCVMNKRFKQHLFEIDFFFNYVEVLTLAFDQFIAAWLKMNSDFLKKLFKNKIFWPQTLEQ